MRVFAQARAAFEAGNFSAAEKLLKHLIATDREFAGSYYYLGRIANATGHKQHAVPLFQEAVRLEPGNIDYITQFAKHLYTNGVKDRAIATLEQAEPQSQSAALKQLLEQMRSGAAVMDSADRYLELSQLEKAHKYDVLLQKAAAILKEDESSLEARYFYALGLGNTGQLDDAIQQLQLVVHRAPENDEAWGHLGVALLNRGQARDSLVAHQRALMLQPSNPFHHVNMGVSYLENGDLDHAESHAKQAIALKGDYVPAIVLLARTQHKRWRYDSARALLGKALTLMPGYLPAQASLVDVSLAEGKLKEAEWECRKLIAQHPTNANAFGALVDSLTSQQKVEEALKFAELGVKRDPQNIPLRNRLGIAYHGNKRYSDSISTYSGILEEAPEFFPARMNLAGMCSQTSAHREAMEHYAVALESDQAGSEHVSNWVFAHLYDPEVSAAELLKISRQWASDQFSDVTPYSSWKVDTAPDAPLRLGIVSGDFREHPVGFFLESVLRRLAALGVELHLYSTVLVEDDASKRFKALAERWVGAYADNPDDFANNVREAGIHVLVDVAGHTAYNRLNVFARKPAPIQITWLGYLSTTGLDTMDYIVGDPWVTPPGEEDHFTEEPLVLPQSYQCLSEPQDSPDVEDLPALANGHVTFGSFNNFAKLNDPVVDLWAEVLKRVEGSVLLLKNQVLTDSAYRDKLAARFAERGISGNQLILEPSRSREHILESYNRVDIGLDPFPYTGCTTSFESLWMGVPVITRTGDRFLSHAGESIMNNLGMPDWIAENAEDYVRIASEKAANLLQLSETRAGLRERLRTSPLMDSDSFAQHFHDALITARSRWLADLDASADESQ